jgi:GNAT superfamily N-acetyltransferase
MDVVHKITFEDVLPIWRDYLWPGRKSEIKPTNGIMFMGGYSKDIESNTPTFFGIYKDNMLVGVNSGHITGLKEYRSRGIYVHPYYRKWGLAQKLFKAVEDQAKYEGCDILWSMPRSSALQSYQKFGFGIVSKLFDKNVEFGPNCFVMKILKGGNDGCS